MKGCINEKKIPVVSFPTDKKFWKGYADYVRDNIKLKKLRGWETAKKEEVDGCKRR